MLPEGKHAILSRRQGCIVVTKMCFCLLCFVKQNMSTHSDGKLQTLQCYHANTDVTMSYLFRYRFEPFSK